MTEGESAVNDVRTLYATAAHEKDVSQFMQVYDPAVRVFDESIQGNKDREGEIQDFDTHTIHVHTDGRERLLQNIPNERLEDYPGGVGNESLE